MRRELTPIVGTLGDAAVEEQSVAGVTDNDLPAYRELIHCTLVTLAAEGVDVDPEMELSPEGLQALRTRLEVALTRVDVRVEWPRFLRPEEGFDIEAIAANPFPGVEYGKPLPGLKLRSECGSDEEYRTQVIPSAFGDLRWAPHPRGIQWKSYFVNASGNAWVDVATESGYPIDRCWPFITMRHGGADAVN